MSRLLTEWLTFDYDKKIIQEAKIGGGPLIMKGILQNQIHSTKTAESIQG